LSTGALVWVPRAASTPEPLTPEQTDPSLLRQMVLDAVPAGNSKRNYGKALDDLFAFLAGRPISRALLMEWRSGMDRLSPSTVNVRLSAMRKLVTEARRNGVLGVDEAANLTDIPNLKQKGNRLGELAYPRTDQRASHGARPVEANRQARHAILALLVGCALRRQELAMLDIDKIQMREGRWVIADLSGKGGRIRTVAIPVWVKQAINAWITAAGIEEGRLLLPVSTGKKARVCGETLTDWSVWSVVERSAKDIGIEHFGAHDLRRTCAKLCRKAGGDLEQIKFLLGHESIQTTERYLGSEQEIAVAVNDNLGL